MNESSEALHEIWYESAGTRLFAVERGHGVPVVYLHGGLADHRASVFRLGTLATTHRLITPDVRGAGRSIHRGELHWDLLADDVVALMQHLGLEHAVVGGSSAGSGVALRVALRHPQRVRALLLIAPVFAGERADLMRAPRVGMERMAAAGQRAVAEGVEAIVPLFEGLPAAIRDVAVAMARGFDPASVAATTGFLAAGTQPFERVVELARVQAPTLVVPGVDPEHPAATAELYAGVIPGAVLGDSTRELASVVEGFLRGVIEDAPRS